MSTKSTAPAAGAQARTVAERLSAGEPYVRRPDRKSVV